MIYEFDPVIYPTKVWVGVDVSLKEIDKTFEAICEDNTGMLFSDSHRLPDTDTDATTYIVGHKKQCMKGCLVIIKGDCQLKSLSHEACHCADYIFEEIGEDMRSYEHGEPYAYYQSWVFECLLKIRGL